MMKKKFNIPKDANLKFESSYFYEICFYGLFLYFKTKSVMNHNGWSKLESVFMAELFHTIGTV